MSEQTLTQRSQVVKGIHLRNQFLLLVLTFQRRRTALERGRTCFMEMNWKIMKRNMKM